MRHLLQTLPMQCTDALCPVPCSMLCTRVSCHLHSTWWNKPDTRPHGAQHFLLTVQAHLRFWCKLVVQAAPVRPRPRHLWRSEDSSTTQAELLHTNGKGIVVLGQRPGVVAAGKGVIDCVAGFCGVPELKVGTTRRNLHRNRNASSRATCGTRSPVCALPLCAGQYTFAMMLFLCWVGPQPQTIASLATRMATMSMACLLIAQAEQHAAVAPHLEEEGIRLWLDPFLQVWVADVSWHSHGLALPEVSSFGGLGAGGCRRNQQHEAQHITYMKLLHGMPVMGIGPM